MTCAQTSTLGVYLLGALDPGDRSTFESHLARCDICRSELVRLSPLPGLLNQITPADFDVTGELPVLTAESPAPVATIEAEAEPPEPLELDLPAEPRSMQAARPRKRYWLIAAAAALVLVLTVGGILGYQALRGGSTTPTAAVVTWSATNPATGVHADVQLIERTWGTEVRVWMSNVPGDRACKLRVVATRDYQPGPTGPYREVAGWWKTGHDPGDEIPGSTSIPLENIYNLEFVDDDDNMLVDIHRPS